MKLQRRIRNGDSYLDDGLGGVLARKGIEIMIEPLVDKGNLLFSILKGNKGLMAWAV